MRPGPPAVTESAPLTIDQLLGDDNPCTHTLTFATKIVDYSLVLRSARNRGKYVDDYLLRSARKRPLLPSDGPGQAML